MPEFETDGCTGAPDGAWHACCLLHDYAYWWQPDGIARGDADAMLAACIAGLGYPGIAAAIGAGVAAFGWIFWRRGRRGAPGTEPMMLTRWVERWKQRKESRDACALDGYKTIIGVVALIGYAAAVQHGLLAEDETIRTAIYGWIVYGLGRKLDRLPAKAGTSAKVGAAA